MTTPPNQESVQIGQHYQPVQNGNQSQTLSSFHIVTLIKQTISQMVPFRTEKEIGNIAKKSVPSEQEIKSWSSSAVNLELSRVTPKVVRHEFNQMFDQLMNQRFPSWFAQWARSSLHDALTMERKYLLRLIEQDNQELLKLVEHKQKWALASIGTVIQGHITELLGKPGYHLINRRYFEAFEKKGDNLLEEYQGKIDNSLQLVDEKINTAVAQQLSWINFKSNLVCCTLLTLGYFMLTHTKL